jgi:hypothetical protein
VRGRILGRLGLQKLVGICVDGVDDIAGGYRGVVDGCELGKLDSMPFRLRLE